MSRPIRSGAWSCIMIRGTLITSFALAGLAKAAPSAHAQSATKCAGDLAAAQIQACMRRPQAPATRGVATPKLRGTDVEVDQTAPDEIGAPQVNLRINFAFDSAALTDAGEQSLRELGQALSAPDLQARKYLLAGHTDSVGAAAYNQRLSQRRAEAIKAFLVGNYHLPSVNISTVGYGMSQPYDRAHPEAAVNRRVQITFLDGP